MGLAVFVNALQHHQYSSELAGDRICNMMNVQLQCEVYSLLCSLHILAYLIDKDSMSPMLS